MADDQEKLRALETAHAEALAALREKDLREHELRQDFAVVTAKYDATKRYLADLLWNELPPRIDALREIPARDSLVAHVPPPPAASNALRTAPLDTDGLAPASAFGASGTIGRYAIGRVLGKGRHGVVYAAREVGEGQSMETSPTPWGGAAVPLAIKVIHKESMLNLRAVMRFALEIELGQMLQHKNICCVHEALASPTHVRSPEIRASFVICISPTQMQQSLVR